MKLSITKFALFAVVLGSLAPLATASPAMATKAKPVAYVALGDSFSSGEGLSNKDSGYLAPSSSGSDHCHRNAKAYPMLVAKALGEKMTTFSTTDPSTSLFRACSGATVSNITGGRDTEGNQLGALSPGTPQYVTITAGGNDLNWADTVKDCLALKSHTSVKLVGTSDAFKPGVASDGTGDKCTADLAAAQSAANSIGQTLTNLYKQVLDTNTSAHLAVLNYPQLTPAGQAPDFCELAGFDLSIKVAKNSTTLGLTGGVVSALNATEATLNSAISGAVSSLQGQYPGRIALVDVHADSSIRPLTCQIATQKTGSDINAIQFAPGSSIASTKSCFSLTLSAPYLHIDWNCVKNDLLSHIGSTASLHPQEAAHKAEANDTKTVLTSELAFGGGGGGGGGLGSATQISAGGSHTCALLTGGTVKCWGLKDNAWLSYGADAYSSTPVSESGISGVTQISAGDDHTCALLTGGTVACWGFNDTGELGNGTTTNSFTPVSVSGLTGVTQISTDHFHTCALLTGGTVACWGYNDTGQLGNGTTTDSSTPVSVSGLTGVTQISAGLYHTCALLTGGTAKCWGSNIAGQLGDGTTTTSSTPVSVSGLTGATQISAGGVHTCALLTGGTVKCWGGNGNGQLGNGTTNQSSTPVSVSGLTGVTQISDGPWHTCALLTGGTVKCWGYNGYGQLGNGTTTDSSTPVSVI